MRPFSPARTTLAPSTFQSRYYQAGDEDERGPDTGPVSGVELETKVHPKVCNHGEGPY